MMNAYQKKQHSKFLEGMELIKTRLVDIITEHGYGNLQFSMVPTEDDIRLLETYPEEIKAWREFMKSIDDEDWNESHFHDVCRGFMAAKGVNAEDGHYLATFCRYNLLDFQYEV